MKHVTLLQARKRAALTQTQLSSLSGVDQGDISRMENGLRGKLVTVMTMDRLDGALRKSGGLKRGDKLVLQQGA